MHRHKPAILDLQRAHLDAALLYFSSPLPQRDRANIAAVGSFEPGIELWDMDVVRGRGGGMCAASYLCASCCTARWAASNGRRCMPGMLC